jgi:RecB family endonuclease NucS
MHIEEVDLKDERELEDVLKKNPEQIEKGLKLIANQVITPKGRIDLLCVDKEGVLTIVELFSSLVADNRTLALLK